VNGLRPGEKLAAARYIELNPVKAQLVENPGDYAWSSAKAHLKQKAKGQNKLLKVDPLLEIVEDWQAFLAETETEETLKALRRHERTGRPLGNAGFLSKLESSTGRILRPQRAGLKRLRDGNGTSPDFLATCAVSP